MRAAQILFPVMVAAVAVIWASESAEGFSHVVGRVGVPTLFAILIGVSLVVWLRPARHRAAEFTALLSAGVYFVTAMLASGPVATAGTELLNLSSYLPLYYALALLFLGPRLGLLISVSVYGALALVAAANLGTGTLDLRQAVPFLVGGGFLLAVLHAAARAIQASAHDHAVMAKAATTDALTGVFNRRGGETILNRLTGPFALIVLDSGGFKRLNDDFGHPAGDAALIRTADLLAREVRGSDVTIRWGGDEFLVVAPDTEYAAAAALNERLDACIRDAEGPLAGLTISSGVATSDGERPWPEVFADADHAMLEAKRRARSFRPAGPPKGHDDRRAVS